MLRPYVELLVHEGFTTVPARIHNVSVSKIDAANAASQEIIRYLATVTDQTAVRRPGEQEAEVGLVHRTPTDGKDIKYFLHIAHDLSTLLGQAPALQAHLRQFSEHLQLLLEVYDELTVFTAQVLALVSQRVSTLMTLRPTVLERFNLSCTTSLPEATTTLRSLLYQAAEQHSGARGHFDRSLITVHLGDRGGRLFGHRSLTAGKACDISPDSGELVLFWGVKALEISHGVLTPLWHSASAAADEDRQALVLFGHIATPEPVTDANVAFWQFCRKHRITDPGAYYEAKMHI
jgi:hypothetical protein